MTRAPDPPYSLSPDNIEWARDFIRVYNTDMGNVLTNFQRRGAVYGHWPGYTVAQLTASPPVPNPSQYRMVMCKDAAGSPSVVPVYSDGTYWRRFSSDAIIS